MIHIFWNVIAVLAHFSGLISLKDVPNNAEKI